MRSHPPHVTKFSYSLVEILLSLLPLQILLIEEEEEEKKKEDKRWNLRMHRLRIRF